MASLNKASLVRRHLTALFVSLIVALASHADAQTPSLSVSATSGAPGANITVSVSLSNAAGIPVASIQWDLLYGSTDLSAVAGSFYTTGAAASTAGKVAACNTISPGDIRCVVAGLNAASLGNGALAAMTFQISATTPSASSVVGISSAFGADAAGNLVLLTASGSAVTIAQSANAALSNLTCTPSVITPPGASLCTVTLSRAALNSLAVTLSSGNSSAGVPASVNVRTGYSAANFTATAPSLGTIRTAIITASLNGVAKSAQLTLTPAGALSSLTCTPANVMPPGASSCTLGLSGAVSTATSVALSTNSSSVVVPGTISIAPGLSGATFPVSTLPVSSNTQAVITASINGSSLSTTLGLTSPGTSQSAGLAAAYGFNAGSGPTAADSSGNGNAATLVNNPAWVTGKWGEAISANGMNQYASVPPIDFSSTKAITVSAWVNRQYSTAGGHVLFEYSTNLSQTNAGFGLYPDDSTCLGIMAGLHGNVGYSVNCYSQPSSGVWHYLTVVYDKNQPGANQVSFYVDGVLQTPTRSLYSSNNSDSFGTHPLYLFSRAGQQQFTAGIIDEMRIYRRALSQTEIQLDMSTPVGSN